MHILSLQSVTTEVSAVFHVEGSSGAQNRLIIILDSWHTRPQSMPRASRHLIICQLVYLNNAISIHEPTTLSSCGSFPFFSMLCETLAEF